MPPTDRKYAKQNLQRALGHCDDIINYLRAVGMAFFNKGEEVEQNNGQFPQEYLDIMGNLDIFIEGQQLIKDGITKIESSF